MPDTTSVFKYTVILPTRNGIGWVGIKQVGGTMQTYVLSDFAAGNPDGRNIDAYTAVYDEGRRILILGEYSYGPPTAWTDQGIWLGEVGPNPGYHAR